MMFNSVSVNDRVKPAIAAPHASLARWKRTLVAVAFALGALLLVLAAPHWLNWVQVSTTSELPTADMVLSGLANELFDPAMAFDSLLSGPMQVWLNSAGQMDALVTLAIIVLAVGSVAGLVQLLRDAQEITSVSAG